MINQKLFATGADRATLFAAPFEAATVAALARSQEEVEQVLEEAVGALAALPTREHAETLAALTRYVGTRRR